MYLRYKNINCLVEGGENFLNFEKKVCSFHEIKIYFKKALFHKYT